MTIEDLVAAIQRMRREDGLDVPPPATEEMIAALSVQFEAAFKIALPAAYERILRMSDGIVFDGLTVWPTRRHGSFRESLIEANHALRDEIDETLVYFGKRDDVLFVFDPTQGRYAAVEMAGLDEWESFDDAESLMVFALSRVVDEEDVRA